MTPKILVVCGPTASGKTALGVALARALNGEVVSADSMQVYRGMDIGTAKPTAEEMGGVPHHMIDVAEPGEDYSAARYVDEATPRVEDILRRGKLPIVVGGTGLYIDALIAGREFAPFTGRWRETLERQAAEEGIEPLYARLAQVDPDRAAKLHLGDEKRIIRALEVWYETGETITAHDESSKSRPPRYEAAWMGLTFQSRAHLWARIDARVDAMAAAGLAEEVRALLERGVSPRCTAMQAIGYKELSAAVMEGGDLAAALEEVKLRSRQYAKRQLTWFRRKQQIHWICWEQEPDISQALRFSTEIARGYGL